MAFSSSNFDWFFIQVDTLWVFSSVTNWHLRIRWWNQTHGLCLKNWVEFMVEVQIRILLMDKVEVQVRILLRDDKLKSCQNTNTANHTLIKEKFLLGFFILQKQLASQSMFLMRSKLSITGYLFLALYGSTSLQSWSFLNNIKNFLCK